VPHRGVEAAQRAGVAVHADALIRPGARAEAVRAVGMGNVAGHQVERLWREHFAAVQGAAPAHQVTAGRDDAAGAKDHRRL
jgi:hypothetical protein